ncbi:hypothetical protein [Kutzneria buriramensis]|uniref:Uncharacterized protein n=1 Tax=Kutzneria buriramensis TaxID=1045776 RepID=A0A3E0I8Y9_9PSEU|nr:hypothetical protein [Kutzneria buriramensis]REH55238.1 hypothetical protein BCF44_101255 [Kutzneria buriramensis]
MTRRAETAQALLATISRIAMLRTAIADQDDATLLLPALLGAHLVRRWWSVPLRRAGAG